MIRRFALAVALVPLVSITAPLSEGGREASAGDRVTDLRQWTSPCPATTLALTWMIDTESSRIWCRTIPAPLGPAEAIAWAIEALAAGPEAVEVRGGAYGEVPVGTQVLSVERGVDRWWVDLSADVVSGGGTASMIGRTTQLRRTLALLSGVDAVQLLVEGDVIVAWGGEGLETPWPWSGGGW